MTAAVSVIVPTYNRAEYLGQALDSLLAQTLPPAQVIVVDDGSTDSTPTLMAGYGERVEYVRRANGGKSAAVNTGLERVRGEYVWVFDDDVALPDAVARFVEALESCGDCGFAWSTCYRTESGPDGRLGRVLCEELTPDVSDDGVLLRLLEFSFMAGAQLFVRASCLREIGGFDEQLVRSQDYDVSLRVARRFRGVFLDGGPTHHLRVHSGPRGNAADRFPAHAKEAKWREYDGIIFRRVLAEFALEEYLPPALRAAAEAAPVLHPRLRRQALLRRLGVMAPRLPVAEVVGDLRAVAELGAVGPLSAQERALFRWAVTRSMYGGTLLWSPEFQREVRRLAGSSRLGRKLRAEVVRAVVVEWPSRDWRTAARGLVNAGAGLARLRGRTSSRAAGTRRRR